MSAALARTAGVEPYAGFAAIYDAAMGDAAFPDIWAAFERARRRYGVRFRSAADIGCGTGQFLERLASSGARLFGVDASHAMIEQARRRLRRTAVTLIEQDVRALRLPQQVDLITCNFCTLNYLLTERDLSTALAQCRANLSEGGWFIGDVLVNAGPIGPQQRIVQHITTPHARSVWTIALDPHGAGSVVDMKTVSVAAAGGQRIWRERHRQRWPQAPRFVQLVHGSGMRVCGLHRMDDGRIAQHDDRWIQFAARAE